MRIISNYTKKMATKQKTSPGQVEDVTIEKIKNLVAERAIKRESAGSVIKPTIKKSLIPLPSQVLTGDKAHIAKLKKALAEKDKDIEAMNKYLEEKDKYLEEKDKLITSQQESIAILLNKNSELINMLRPHVFPQQLENIGSGPDATMNPGPSDATEHDLE